MRRRFTSLIIGGLCLVGGLQHSAHGQTRAEVTVTPADYVRWRTEFKKLGSMGPRRSTRHVQPDHRPEGPGRGRPGQCWDRDLVGSCCAAGNRS